jgi:hypothetical protein
LRSIGLSSLEPDDPDSPPQRYGRDRRQPLLFLGVLPDRCGSGRAPGAT